MQETPRVGADVQPDGWASLALDIFQSYEAVQKENQFLIKQIFRLKNWVLELDGMADVGDPYSVFIPSRSSNE